MSALSLSLALPVGQRDIALTPPTIAPVLMVSANLDPQTANLEWTASNKTSSAGFGYQIEVDINGGGFNSLVNTTSLFYNHVTGALGDTYTYKVIPYNAAGEGPASNESDIFLPAP